MSIPGHALGLRLGHCAPDQPFDQRRPFLQQEFLERNGDRRQALVLLMHDVPLAHDREAIDVKHREPSELEFVPMVWAERKLIPMPAMTACLMVSVLLISIVILNLTRNSASSSSITRRVSEPCSRTMKRFVRQCLQRNVPLARKPVPGRGQ